MSGLHESRRFCFGLNSCVDRAVHKNGERSNEFLCQLISLTMCTTGM